MRFYDTHTHLDYPAFAGDLGPVIARAQAAGIARIITLGTDLAGSARCLKIAEQYPNVYAGAGWHPTHVFQNPPEDLRPALREFAQHPKVVAIGETGLDHYRRPEGCASEAEFKDYKERQARYFRQHLEVALEFGLPCVIHQRDSFAAILEELAPFAGKVRGVFHCFSESVEGLGSVLDLGLMVSYTGILTFPKGQNVRDDLAATPMDRFMLETDSPFLVPAACRGKQKRCEPAFLRETALMAAEIKKCSLEELSAVTCRTAEKLFSKMA